MAGAGHLCVWQLAVGFERSDSARGFKAVHLRHLAVHEHEVESRAFDGFDSGRAVGNDFAVIAVLLERFGGHNLVDVVIFGQQDS